MHSELVLFLTTVVFWGGIAYFVGIVLVDSFATAQERIVRKTVVFQRAEYYEHSFVGRIGYILVYSALLDKLKLCVFLCLYVTLCAILAGATETSITAFEQLFLL